MWIKEKIIFEGDFKSCFDTLSHQHILDKLDNFPLKGIIKKWLEAGYLENNVFHKTRTGTSTRRYHFPLLANIALDGMEEALTLSTNKESLKMDMLMLIRATMLLLSMPTILLSYVKH